MKKLSVVMATYNSVEVVEDYLRSIREQDFDQEALEIVVADGGSTDGTIEVVERYGGRVIRENTGSPEAAKGVALAEAKGEYVLIGDGDNVWPDEGWLSLMMESLWKEKGLASYPWRYKWRREDRWLNRYFALLGANDPVAWFLGKADRQSYLREGWGLGGKLIKECEDYFVVEYDESSLPTVGANGFLIRRDELLKAKSGVDDYFHIDVIYDLVKSKPRRFVVVKTEIIHQTGNDLGVFLKKRERYMRELYLEDKDRRRYFIYKKGRDDLRLALFVAYALSGVGPLMTAVWGMVKKWDWAWLGHVVMCWSLLVIYGKEVVKGWLGKGGD